MPSYRLPQPAQGGPPKCDAAQTQSETESAAATPRASDLDFFTSRAQNELNFVTPVETTPVNCDDGDRRGWLFGGDLAPPPRPLEPLELSFGPAQTPYSDSFEQFSASAAATASSRRKRSAADVEVDDDGRSARRGPSLGCHSDSALVNSDRRHTGARRRPNSDDDDDSMDRSVQTAAAAAAPATDRTRAVLVAVAERRLSTGVGESAGEGGWSPSHEPAFELGLAVFDPVAVRFALHEFRGPSSRLAQLALDMLAERQPLGELCVSSKWTQSAVTVALRAQHPHALFSVLPRKAFSSAAGVELVNAIACRGPSGEPPFPTAHYSAAAAAAGALLGRLDTSLAYSFAPGSVQVDRFPAAGTGDGDPSAHGGIAGSAPRDQLWSGAGAGGVAVAPPVRIDADTASQLELLVNLEDGTARGSLFAALNHTRTAGGAALLRREIRAPPADLAVIGERQQCVASLLANPVALLEIHQLLARFGNTGLLCAQFARRPKVRNLQVCAQHVRAVLELKKALDDFQQLSAVVGPAPSDPLLARLASQLAASKFVALAERIDEIIDPSALPSRTASQMRTQMCFAVRPNVQGLLDVSRKTLSETRQDMSQLVVRYADEYGLNDLKLVAAGGARGYILSMRARDRPLPDIFIKVNRGRKNWTFTTAELVSLCARNKSSLNEILLVTDRVIEDLLNYVRAHLALLYDAAQALSRLDFLVSLAMYARSAGGGVPMTMPEFTSAQHASSPPLSVGAAGAGAAANGPIAVKKGVHPLLFACPSKHGPVVPNDLFLGGNSNFQLITGPNGSGKTCLLRMAGLLVIMAHLGSCVPAQFMSTRLVDRVGCVMGDADQGWARSASSSSFVRELRLASFALENCSPASLLLIDEFGKTTSSRDGCALARALAEALVDAGPSVLLATHMQSMVRLADERPSVRVYNMSADTVAMSGSSHPWQSRTRFLFTVDAGPCRRTSYGIVCARTAGLPVSLCEDAERMVVEKIAPPLPSAKQSDGAALRQGTAAGHGQLLLDDEQCQLADRLLLLRFSTIGADNLLAFLRELKQHGADH